MPSYDNGHMTENRNVEVVDNFEATLQGEVERRHGGEDGSERGGNGIFRSESRLLSQSPSDNTWDIHSVLLLKTTRQRKRKGRELPNM